MGVGRAVAAVDIVTGRWCGIIFKCDNLNFFWLLLLENSGGESRRYMGLRETVTGMVPKV